MKKHLSKIIFILCFVVGFISMQNIGQKTQTDASWFGTPADFISEIDHTVPVQSDLFEELAIAKFPEFNKVFYVGCLQEIVITAEKTKRRGIYEISKFNEANRVSKESYPSFMDECLKYSDRYEWETNWRNT